MTLEEQRQYRLGLAYVAISALAWSSSGVFMRLISADLTTILFCRGMFSGTCIFVFFFYVERQRAWAILRQIGWPTIGAAVFSSASMISGLGAMYYTSVADAMVIYATVPFVTAGVAYVLIGEKPSRSTLIASGVAFAGVLVMLAGAEGGQGTLLGKGLAVVMTITVALMATIMRQHRGVPMLPAMGLSAWLTSFITIWFASPFGVSGTDIGLIICFAVVQNALGLILYTYGAPRIPAADASLLTALEVPLTPLWVWIFMSEVPSRATLIGGPIVLAALFGHIVMEVRRNRVVEVPSAV